jgi:cytochrome b561
LIRHLKPSFTTATLSVWRLCARAFSSGASCAAGNAADARAFAATMLQTVLALAVVIGVLFLAAYLLRKLNGGRGFGSTALCASSAA